MSAPAPLTSERSQFVTAIRDAFDEAGVEHVFLHGFDRDARDSDVDVAVARECLDIVDLIVRTGRLGRPLQRFDYDVPWCRYYVVASTDPERRYRQLDVACDPSGIGKYGPAVRVALDHRRRVEGLCVPEPAAEALYLAVKRARKGLAPGELERLRNAFQEDRTGATDLLRQELGPAGECIAVALGADADLEAPLRELRRILDSQRRPPAQLARRAFFGASRFGRRVARPTGLVVGLAGPDGVGKSTLAEGLEVSSVGAFRAVRRLHLGPGLLPPPSRLLGRRVATGKSPHARSPSGPASSMVRVAYLALDTLLGWPSRVAVPRVRSTLVLLERGLLDLAVDPRRYRLSMKPRILPRVERVLPHPHLVLLLDAPASVVRGRKAELSLAEIDRQSAEWRAHARRRPGQFRIVDASASPEDVLLKSLDIIDAALAVRQGRLELAAIALDCLGGPVARGKPHILVSARGQPRWILPRGMSPVHAGVYRPASRRHSGAAGILGWAAQAIGSEIPIDPRAGLAPHIAKALAVEVELAAAIPREQSRKHRAVLSVLSRRRVVAFAKVSRQGLELEYEAAVLEAILRCQPSRIVVPRVLELFEWRDVTVLLLEPITAPGSTDRTVGSPEREALVELAALTERLAPTLGHRPGFVAAHGDFTAWNSAPLPDGRLALWDWEDARLGLPLEDFFQWKVRHLVMMGNGDAEMLAREALAPSHDVVQLCNRLGLGPGSPTQALLACLRREAARMRPASQNAEIRKALHLIERATA